MKRFLNSRSLALVVVVFTALIAFSCFQEDPKSKTGTITFSSPSEASNTTADIPLNFTIFSSLTGLKFLPSIVTMVPSLAVLGDNKTS